MKINIYNTKDAMGPDFDTCIRFSAIWPSQTLE